MALPNDLPPGVLSPVDAAVLNAAIAASEATARKLDALLPAGVSEIPAKITAWDAATQRATWVERAFDKNGNRYDKPAGLFGGPTYSPAVPYGNGLMPPNELPIDVRLTRRVVAVQSGSGGLASIGVVWEFPWHCSLAGSGSGAGGSGSGGQTLVACCPGALPNTLYGTITQTAGTACAADGTTVVMVYSAGTGYWEGTADVGGNAWGVRLECSGGGWVVTLQAPDGPNGRVGTTVSCAPLQVTASGYLLDSLAAVCPTTEYSVTVTE